MALPCVLIGPPPGNHRIVFPGGLAVETPPIFNPYNRMFELEQMFKALAPAMAALGPFFTMLGMVTAVIDMIKALATLNPVKIAAALVDFLEEAEKILSLAPPLSLPLMILGLLQLVVDMLTAMIDFLTDIKQAQENVDAMKDYAEREGLDDMLQDALCLEQNLDTRMEYFSNAVGQLAIFLVLVESLGAIAGIDLDLSISEGDSIDDTLDALAGFVDTISTIIETVEALIP